MFKGIVTLVTGGASGLGRATAARLLKDGSKVVICDLPASNIDDIQKEFGDAVLFAPADVSSEKDMEGVIASIREKYGRLDVAVNCAGIATAQRVYHFGRSKPHSLEEYSKVIKVNVVGTFNVVRLAVGLMGENAPDADGQRGVVVNTASVAAYDGQIGQCAYAASKAAIVGMTLPLARDLSTHGIRVVTIAPGLFDTPMMKKLPEKARKELAATVPFPHRLGNPEEYAQLVTSIISNPLLNGETIRLDGALRMQP